MRVTENPDFFAGLPMQSAQWVLKKAAGDMSSWLRSLKSCKAGTPGFTGKPRMPKYKKGGEFICTYAPEGAGYIVASGMPASRIFSMMD